MVEEVHTRAILGSFPLAGDPGTLAAESEYQCPAPSGEVDEGGCGCLGFVASSASSADARTKTSSVSTKPRAPQSRT
jgi:hypothetical protein